MKILMIMPKYVYAEKSLKPNYNYFFPIGICYVYAIIKKNGYDIEAYNLNHENGKVEDLMEKKLSEKNYDIVCIGGMSIDYQVIEKIISTCRLHKSNPKIILGGPIITSNKELIAKNLNFDIGVIGEGELTIIELLKKLEDGKTIEKVNGICYKKDNKIIFTEKREPIMDLDSLPYPDYDAFGFSKVLENTSSLEALFGCSKMDYPRTYPVMGSRGCPFQCTFCYHSIGPIYRVRSIKNILGEIEFAIKKYQINSFNLHDDLFSINKERLIQFCEEIKKLNEKYSIKLSWMCQLWVGVVTKEILLLLKEAGCVVVSFGFESYSKKILKSMKKPITPEQIDTAVKLCLETNLTFIGNFIFGDIEETKETARETIDYWKENCHGQAKLFFIHPYPGSEIYQSCLKRGIIKDELNFIKNEIHHTNIRNMTLNMTKEEFDALKKEVYSLTSKNFPHTVPLDIQQEKGNKYSLLIKCPYCKEEYLIKNCIIRNKRFYSASIACKHCGMKYNLSSSLYKFTMKNYILLDSLRKTYLAARDRFLKKDL